MNVLETQNLTMEFGGIKAVSDLNLHVQKSSITALIGPNGAGKTTVFNMLTGVYEPTKGIVNFQKEEIQGLKPYSIVKKGIARTFQNIRLFKSLSVLENVLIAGDINLKYSIFSGLLSNRSFHIHEERAHDNALGLLKIFGLDSYAHLQSSSLPYGAQRRLEIARALATNSKLLLLDEPAAGMNNQETKN